MHDDRADRNCTVCYNHKAATCDCSECGDLMVCAEKNICGICRRIAYMRCKKAMEMKEAEDNEENVEREESEESTNCITNEETNCFICCRY